MLNFFKDKFWFTENIPNKKYTKWTDSIMIPILSLLTVVVGHSDSGHDIHLLIFIPGLTCAWAYNHIIITLLSNKDFFKDKGLRLRFINSTILTAFIFFIINMSLYIF